MSFIGQKKSSIGWALVKDRVFSNTGGDMIPELQYSYNTLELFL